MVEKGIRTSMAGHSKFKNIMYRKGAQDAKRAKIFARVGREIMVAVGTSGNADPDKNPRLRAALALARSHNMPKENIKKAMDKALGGDVGDNMEEVVYEGYGPGGTAIIVETLTDNRNRTASEVRTPFTKFGGNLGETGSVSYLFDHVGFVSYPKTRVSFDDAFEFGADHGAEDVEDEDTYIRFVTSKENFATLRDVCIERFGDPEDQGLVWLPKTTVAIPADKIEQFEKLLSKLEELDDVQEVYANNT